MPHPSSFPHKRPLQPWSWFHTYQEVYGAKQRLFSLQASGWQARILQHEVDHIRGTLYIDRMHSRTFVHASVMPTQDFEAAMPLGSCSCSHSID